MTSAAQAPRRSVASIFAASDPAGRASQQKIAAILTATAILLVGWYTLSIFNKPWVPSPFAVAETIGKDLVSADIYARIGITLARVLVTFIVAAAVGSVIGILMGLNRRLDAFFVPLVAIALAIPDPVYIIIAVLVIGPNELATVVALTFAVSPYVINFVRGAVAARDLSLDEMTKIYRIPRWQAFRVAVLPQLIPAVLTATRFSFAMSWKLIVIIEALGRSDGIGAGIVRAFRFLKMDQVVAYAVIFIVVMQLIERQVLVRIEKRLLRWRH